MPQYAPGFIYDWSPKRKAYTKHKSAKRGGKRVNPNLMAGRSGRETPKQLARRAANYKKVVWNASTAGAIAVRAGRNAQATKNRNAQRAKRKAQRVARGRRGGRKAA